MNFDENTIRQLQNIISGASITEQESIINTTRNFLCSSFATNKTIKKDFEYQQRIKEKQELELISFAKEHNLFLENFIDEELYLTEGGEAKIYLSKDGSHVLKINDGIYYSNWLDFINSICIHNIIFPETSYQLLGFLLSDSLSVLLKQKFIISNEDLDLEEVETILNTNEFEKIKKLDYYNAKIGIRLEDIHDENVIKQNGIYFFIDTVFYLDLPK